MIKVRRAAEQDIPRILELLVQVCMVHHNGRPDLFNGPATKYTGEELANLLKDESRPIFVGVNEKDEVLGHGFCVLEEHKNNHVLTDIKTLYIDDICVDEKARGQHVGRTIYQAIQEYARSIGCYNITLNVWTCNPGAMKFYENCGLKPQKIGMEEIL